MSNVFGPYTPVQCFIFATHLYGRIVSASGSLYKLYALQQAIVFCLGMFSVIWFVLHAYFVVEVLKISLLDLFRVCFTMF